jgi:hypothetical protein
MSTTKILQIEVEAQEDVVNALCDMGVRRDLLQISESAVKLSRSNLREAFDISSYRDMSFEKGKEGYQVKLDSDIQRWWGGQKDRFLQLAAASKITRHARKKGYTVRRSEERGQIKLQLTGY